MYYMVVGDFFSSFLNHASIQYSKLPIMWMIHIYVCYVEWFCVLVNMFVVHVVENICVYWHVHPVDVILWCLPVCRVHCAQCRLETQHACVCYIRELNWEFWFVSKPAKTTSRLNYTSSSSKTCLLNIYIYIHIWKMIYTSSKLSLVDRGYITSCFGDSCGLASVIPIINNNNNRWVRCCCCCLSNMISIWCRRVLEIHYPGSGFMK